MQRLDERIARARDWSSGFPPVLFSREDAAFLVGESRGVVRRRGGVLYGVTVTESHIHLVAGWREKVDAEEMQGRLKRGYGFLLAGRHGTKGKPYFSRGGLPKRVRDRGHLRYLLYEYFPEHDGAMWRVEME